MKILYASSEAVPFIKTGGLADVAGTLPIEMKKQGIDIRVVLPLYSKIPSHFREKMKKIGEYYTDLTWRRQYVGVYCLEYEGVIFYFLDNEQYFKRDGLYGYPDDGERFTFFAKAVALLPKIIDFKVDIIHTNDWHTAMVNVYLQDFKRGDRFYERIKSVFTIHNLKYQGIFPSQMLFDVAGLDGMYYNEESLKYYDAINMMKGGIVFSDAFTTVSKTYAQEIRYPYFGETLEGIVNRHYYKMTGIINGIDYQVWNPETDEYLPYHYSLTNWENGKKLIKKEIQKKYGLPEKDVPMIAMITRMVKNKGLDLVRHIFDELIQEDIQFVILGTGDDSYEESFRYFAWRYPEKVASRIYYNEEESHQVYAASDLFLMPSLTEPCGISQLIALRYGSLPIVRETGGLKDTVKSYNEYEKSGNGFSFANINAHDMLYTIRRALHFLGIEADKRQLINNAMNSKNSWETSSRDYIKLYKTLIK